MQRTEQRPDQWVPLSLGDLFAGLVLLGVTIGCTSYASRYAYLQGDHGWSALFGVFSLWGLIEYFRLTHLLMQYVE